MSERELSRQLATRVVDALRTRARIAVVKGGVAALARQLDAAMAPEMGGLELSRDALAQRSVADSAAEALAARASRALLDSEHVEDLFADASTLRREVALALRSALEEAARTAAPARSNNGLAAAAPLPVPIEVPQAIQVRLDTLGYVASTVGKLAPEAALRQALQRAAASAGGTLSALDTVAREASFQLTTSDPDARLEIEEAVADELSALVEAKIVSLPTVIRRVELGHALPPEERGAARPRIDAAASRTLLRSGCAASWELENERTLKVTVTPLSEQDALEVDHYVGLFARELASLPPAPGGLGGAGAESGADAESGAAPAPAPAPEEPAAPEAEAAPEDSPKKPAPRRRVAHKAPAEEPAPEPPAPRKAAKKTAAKRAAKTPASGRGASAKKAPGRSR